MLVDSHCHLNLIDKDSHGCVGDLIESAKKVGVGTVLCVGVDLETAPEVIAIAERFDQVWASVGLHPSHQVAVEPTAQDYLAFTDHPKVVAMGEMGLDYHYNKENLQLMRERFRVQIRVAHQINKPIIIHTREAPDDTIQIMREEKVQAIGGGDALLY